MMIESLDLNLKLTGALRVHTAASAIAITKAAMKPVTAMMVEARSW
jgi:hypothetical protein